MKLYQRHLSSSSHGQWARGLASSMLAVSLLAALLPAPARADDRDLLRKGSGKPYVFIIFDTSGSMHWSPKCSQADFLAGICDSPCPSGDCFVPENGDDPASKLYQAKEALYEVIEAASSVDFGFATYNQDQLRVRAKHWLYTARTDGVDLGGIPFPALGSTDVFGPHWPCATGRRDGQIGCDSTTPADLADPWEAERVRRLPKGGAAFDQRQTFYVRSGAQVLEITYRPSRGMLGDPTVDVQIQARRCTGRVCNQVVGNAVVTFDLVDQFISWDIQPGRTNPQLGYFSQQAASGALASNTCGGLEGNQDTGSDGFNGVNLKFSTQNSPVSNALDLGDLIPLDWTDDNRVRLLDRLAPNRLLGELTPDFSVARYFQNAPGGGGVLDLASPSVRPLVAFGSTPLGNAVRDFRTWYSGCPQGNCPRGTGWKDVASANDPDWGCRSTYLLVITDGDDTCGGADACSGTASLYAQEDVKTYVVAFGVENTPGNRLNCMAANGGSGNPIYPQNKQQLVDALTKIFSEIQEEARSFASAAVPSVQASVDDKIFLSNFTPLNESSLWDGHLDAFLEPLPLVQSGPDAGRPDRSKRCSAAVQSGCLAWDAGEKLLEQAQALDLGALPPDYGMGPLALERRVFYAKDMFVPGVPDERLLFEPPPDPPDPTLPATFGDRWWHLLDGLGIPRTDPDAIGKAKRTIENVLRPKTVRVQDPTAVPPVDKLITFVLGDIFHSNPVTIGAPDNLTYFVQDAGARTITVNGAPVEVGGYQEFALRHRVRRKMVLTGSNDGQLHVFDAGLYSSTLGQLTRSDPTYFPCLDDQGRQVSPVPIVVDERFGNGTGYELFSFVPRASMDNLPKLLRSNAHRYSVDGTVTVGDVNIGPTDRATRADGTEYVNDWRTVAVGGLRRGGRGYYALDITQPDRITEELICTRDGVERSTSVAVATGDGYVPSCLGDLQTGAAATSGCGLRPFPAVLWELEDPWDEDGDGAPDLGDTWSTPAIGRIRVCNGAGFDCDPSRSPNRLEDRWVAVFGGGFDERARFLGPAPGSFLYMVDIASGEVIYKQLLDGMAPSEPAVLDADLNGYIDRVYIGTTAGSLYKVDLRTVPQMRDVQVSPGPSQPLQTVRRISTAVSHDPEWRPFRIFDTGGRPIFYPPSLIFVAGQSKFAIALGTGDRDDLWSNDPQTGRFYVFLDNDLRATDSALPVDVTDLQPVAVADANRPINDNLLVPSPGATTAGWYLDLEPRERLITKPFALSGVLFFTSYMPQDTTGSTGGGQVQNVCARTGESRIFVVFATNANALIDSGGTRTRYRLVPEFVTDPFSKLSSTDNVPVPGDPGPGLPGHADDVCRAQAALTQELMTLFPDSCRFASYTLDIQTIRSDRGLVCIAPVPICFQEQNWLEQ